MNLLPREQVSVDCCDDIIRTIPSIQNHAPFSNLDSERSEPSSAVDS